MIAAVALGVAGLGGTALATSSSGGNSFFDDVAHRLGVSPEKLQSAVNGALADRLDRLVKQGNLTRVQADAILKHAKAHGGTFPFGGWAPFGKHGHRFGGPGEPGEFGFRHNGLGPLAGAAKYLGLSAEEFMDDLRSGKSLAGIAKAQGKSVSGLESAMVAPLKARLDAAVRSGLMSKSEAQHTLARLTKGIDAFVGHGFKLRMHHDSPDGASAPAAFGL